MLKQLRNKKTAKKIWITLAIIVVPAFVLWGSGSVMRSKQGPNYAGKIFGKRISYLEYRDAMDAVRNLAIMRYGDKLSEIEKHLNLESEAWVRLILLYEAKNRRITVNDKEVIEAIENYPEFQQKGRFDNKAYNWVLQYYLHTQPRLFEEQTRQNLMISKLYEQLTKNITVSLDELKNEYQKLNEEISVYYIAAFPADFAKDISPQEQDLKAYFTKNALNFKQPESFNLDYVTSESEDKIRSMLLILNRKVDFSKAAGETGLETKETGLFTQTQAIPGIGWSAEILTLIAKLKTGEVSPPIHMDKYYYILKLKEKKESYIPDFENIKDKVKETYVLEESQKIAKTKIEDCLKKLKELYKQNPKLTDFINTAKEFGLKSDSTASFKYGSYIEGIGASDNLWMAALELKDDFFSEIVSMPSGFFIIKPKSRTPLDEKKFESEKADFSQKLLFLKKQEFFAKFIEELKIKAQ